MRLVLEMSNVLETLYVMKILVLQSKNLVTHAKNQTNVLMDLSVSTHAENKVLPMTNATPMKIAQPV